MNNKIIHAALFTPTPEGFWGAPILGWGRPGTGKTKGISAAAAAANLPFYRLSPAEAGEGQFGVVPVPGADGFLHYPAPEWVQKFNTGCGGVLFVDEISTAPPALQAPLLGLVQLRTIGAYTFGPRVRIIAAANETQDAAGGWDLAPALANRFGHFDFEGLSPNDWVTGLLGGFANTDDNQHVDAETEEARVMAAWPSAIAMARGLVASFITRRPNLLHNQPSRASNNTSRAWPSRRSVEYATYALASARVHGLNEVDTDEFIGGFVGLAWVTEFATHRVNLDLPDPAELLDGKVDFKHNSRRLDRTMAVLSSIAALVAPENAAKRKERGNAAWKIIASVIEETADVAIPAATTLSRARLVGGDYKACQSPLSKLFPTMKEAKVA
jgi:hypothetical protein